MKHDGAQDEPLGETYIIATDPHFTVGSDSIFWWHLQFDIEFSLRQIHFWGNLATTKINNDGRCTITSKVLTRFKEEQMQIFIREPVPLVTFQRELFRLQET